MRRLLSGVTTAIPSYSARIGANLYKLTNTGLFRLPTCSLDGSVLLPRRTASGTLIFPTLPKCHSKLWGEC